MDRIRVSCAVLCRVEHAGRYLLLINDNRRRRGVYVLSPIGGALTYYDADPLLELGAEFEDPTTQDLRLTLPVEALGAFREWFYSGVGRERSPFREIHEELVQETKLLPMLLPREVEYHWLWTAEQEALTGRMGQTGVLTQYFLEIYDVTFTSARALGPLLDLPPESGALWTTPELIVDCAHVQMDVDGERRAVRVNGLAVLRPPADAGVASEI